MGSIVFLLFFAVAGGALASQLARVLCGRQETVSVFVDSKPFVVSEYWKEMDRHLVDILQKQKPVDQIIILWWGLDGLTLDENGELKWISRKKPEPVNQDVFYHPCQGYNQIVNRENMLQSQQAVLNSMQYQNIYWQIQTAHQVQMENFISQIQACCAQPPRPGYLNLPY